jgi:hypothetical protein
MSTSVVSDLNCVFKVDALATAPGRLPSTDTACNSTWNGNVCTCKLGFWSAFCEYSGGQATSMASLERYNQCSFVQFACVSPAFGRCCVPPGRLPPAGYLQGVPGVQGVQGTMVRLRWRLRLRWYDGTTPTSVGFPRQTSGTSRGRGRRDARLTLAYG